jgi:RNA polymerase sigma-70 factor (ECF subfamily)
MGEYDHSTQIIDLLKQLHAGNASVRAALIFRAHERLRRLAQRMLQRHRDLRSVVETDDVLQGALVRLHRSLPEVKPTEVRRFFGLATTQIRRELIDLVRRHLGQGGAKAARVSYVGGSISNPPPLDLEQQADVWDEPCTLESWREFHEKVDQLPEEEKEVFDLLWYQELSQADVAALLEVSERTVKRRWRSARLLLHAALRGEWPGQ